MKYTFPKIITIASLILFASTFLAGCGTSNSPIWMVKLRGRNNAIEYIENKYGQKPKVKRTHARWGSGVTFPGCLPSLSDIGPTGLLECKMELNGEDFELIIDGDTKNYSGFDTYEKNLICESIEKDISNSLKITGSDVAIRYTALSTYNGDYFYQDKFEDLETFYNNSHTFVFFSTTDKINEELLYDYVENHIVSNPKSVLRIFVIQYDDESNVHYQRMRINDYYLDEDEHILDYYDLYLTGGSNIAPIRHNGQETK